MTTELIKKELTPVALEAMSLKVKSHGDLLVATDLLTRLNQIHDRIEEEKQKVLAPLNEARTAEIKRWKPVLGFYEDSIKHLREELTNYQTTKALKQKIKEKIIADKLASGELDMDQALAKIEKIKAPEKNIIGSEGDVRFREVQRLKIWDHTMIPREYMLPDEKLILSTLKEGKKVEGCELEVIQVPYNFRQQDD